VVQLCAGHRTNGSSSGSISKLQHPLLVLELEEAILQLVVGTNLSALLLQASTIKQGAQSGSNGRLVVEFAFDN
jgi:hypothetical protein